MEAGVDDVAIGNVEGARHICGDLWGRSGGEGEHALDF